MTAPLTIDRAVLPDSPGWHRTRGKPYGAHRYPTSWRLFFAEPFQGSVSAFGRTWSVGAPARGTLTLRPSTVTVEPYFKDGSPSDFSGGGAFDIGPWGDAGTVLDHDRIARRVPVERLNLDTGERITTPVQDYNLSSYAPCPPYPAAAWPWMEPDGEHGVRGWRIGVRFTRDPAVLADLCAQNENNKLFWLPYGHAILAGPSGKGHGYVGRSWAWSAWLASHVDREFAKFMRRVAEHVVDMKTGATQRLEDPDTHGGVGFHGGPQPWLAWKADGSGGSGVPAGVSVFQKLEAYHVLGAFRRLGMKAAALKLANTVLAFPGKKWCACDTGQPIGQHADDYEQNWIGLSAVAQYSPELALTFAQRWPIMDKQGSVRGPYADKAAILAALGDRADMGKCRPFVEAMK